ncbi:hypothetical protein [Nonomuraea insulae]|uniref:Uncharacterized protein n=1 Tax=Nonomuraea insulae TaxID=1616787 RepID=A0ABW1DA02_9ACTN
MNTAMELRSVFESLGVEEYVRILVDAAPPLKLWQRDRLAVLFREAA